LEEAKLYDGEEERERGECSTGEAG
jgi:hypothetical protein